MDSKKVFKGRWEWRLEFWLKIDEMCHYFAFFWAHEGFRWRRVGTTMVERLGK